MKAMQEGKIGRIEELTRIGSDVQDTLITILSEKTLPIPELNQEIQAIRGFNIIAVASTRSSCRCPIRWKKRWILSAAVSRALRR